MLKMSKYRIRRAFTDKMPLLRLLTLPLRRSSSGQWGQCNVVRYRHLLVEVA